MPGIMDSIGAAVDKNMGDDEGMEYPEDKAKPEGDTPEPPAEEGAAAAAEPGTYTSESEADPFTYEVGGGGELTVKAGSGSMTVEAGSMEHDAIMAQIANGTLMKSGAAESTEAPAEEVPEGF